MAQNISIVDRVVERIKTSPVGDLITDEDLYDIVKDAIERAFFTDRYVKDSAYSPERRLPPLIVDAVKESLSEQVAKHVKTFFAANADRYVELMNQTIENGIVKVADRIVQERASKDVSNALMAVVGAINKERDKAGLPYLNL